MMEPNGLKLKRKSGNTEQQQPTAASATTGLWVTVVALALALTSLTAYGYVVLDRYDIELSQLPGLSGALTTLGVRVETAEAKLSQWAADADRLEAQLKQVNACIRHHRKIAELHADKAVAALEEKLSTQMTERAQAVNEQLTTIEMEQDAERAFLASLDSDVNSLRQETRQEVAGLRRNQVRSQRDLSNLSARLERRRVDFELAKGRTVELTPGVSLHVQKTNVSHQRVKGWLWLMPDARAVWVRDLGAQQSLVFYTKESSEPRELIITRVGKKGVVGYLLLPAHDNTLTVSAPPVSKPVATGASPASGL